MKKVNGRTEVILYTNTVQLLPETECVCVCVCWGGGESSGNYFNR